MCSENSVVHQTAQFNFRILLLHKRCLLWSLHSGSQSLFAEITYNLPSAKPRPHTSLPTRATILLLLNARSALQRLNSDKLDKHRISSANIGAKLEQLSCLELYTAGMQETKEIAIFSQTNRLFCFHANNLFSR